MFLEYFHMLTNKFTLVIILSPLNISSSTEKCEFSSDMRQNSLEWLVMEAIGYIFA